MNTINKLYLYFVYYHYSYCFFKIFMFQCSQCALTSRYMMFLDVCLSHLKNITYLLAVINGYHGNNISWCSVLSKLARYTKKTEDAS